MDNKENKRLSDDNQKWLDDLLNSPSSQEVGAGALAAQFAKPEETPAAIPEDEQVILDAKALIAEVKTLDHNFSFGQTAMSMTYSSEQEVGLCS